MSTRRSADRSAPPLEATSAAAHATRFPWATALVAAAGLVAVAASAFGASASYHPPFHLLPSVPPPTPPVQTPAQRPSVAPAAGGIRTGANIGWVFELVGVIILAIIVVIVVRRLVRYVRRGRAASVAPVDTGLSVADTTGGPEKLDVERLAPALRTGLDAASDALSDAARAPRDAIVIAWVGLEFAAGQSGLIRSGSETATEFTRRILARVGVDAQALDVLLGLYLKARFSTAEPSLIERQTAMRAVDRLAEQWKALTSTDRASAERVPAERVVSDARQAGSERAATDNPQSGSVS